MVTTILVDRTNFAEMIPQIVQEVSNAPFIGIDVETQDDGRHPGLNAFCKYNPLTRKKADNTKTVFDVKRTVMTGFSIYADKSEFAYYVNLNHVDVENRLRWDEVAPIIAAKKPGSYWLAHNLPYELTMYRSCYAVHLDEAICTLQLAVSAFGPDEYEVSNFISAQQGGIRNLIPQLLRNSYLFNPDNPRQTPKALFEIMNKITAKESDADHSYNGLVASVAYGYGLKRLVKSFFGVSMTTFKDVLGDKAHMGQLTGAEVAAYGADDAYWAVQLFHKLLTYIMANCPQVWDTFFKQENPMAYVFSDMWYEGMRVTQEAILQRRDEERISHAETLREMKKHLATMLPFPEEKNAKLAKADKWYADNWQKYRQQIIDFVNAPDSDNPLDLALQVRGPVSNAWATDLGRREPTGVNLSHYMPQRTLLYDLTGDDPIITLGKTQSDGEARGKLKDRWQETDPTAAKMVDYLNKLAQIDQRMKLYLTPYSQLMDPDTARLHPTVSSMLATRRMGCTTPNAMQLAKRGESTYVRGFFEADYDDHLIISCDWSGIELVEIGEFSADPEFIKAFGQLPHQDLHSGTAADVLSVEVPGLDEEIFKSLKKFESEDDFRREYGNHLGNMNRLFTNLKGEALTPAKSAKYWRTEVGKGANFGYWYSGFLGTVGDTMGWDMKTTGAASDRFKQRFSVAEQWRLNLIAEVQRTGRVILPDGHRRVRFEATEFWADIMRSKFHIENPQREEALIRYNSMWNYLISQIQKRANNQAVNAMIQGSCATLAKRSILRILDKVKAKGWSKREFRFMVPIHDELVFSVHRSIVLEAIEVIRGTMIDHPDMFQHCALDAAPSIGLTFEPFDPKKAPYGQLEVFEAPPIACIPADRIGLRMTDDEVLASVDYLFHTKQRAA